jgi:hypothetical protein
MSKHSSFDAVQDHMLTRGCHEAAEGLEGDLEMIVRRAERVRSLGAEYGHVELSPYMQSLLRVTSAIGVSKKAEHAAVAASV